MLRVLLDALVGIDADLAGEAQQVGALGREPLVEQVVGQPFAQADVGHLPQPGLGDDQHEQAAGDHHEDQELGREGRDVLLLDRVVEGALPAVEPDLPRGVGADDDDDARCQETQPAAVGRGGQRPRHHHQLRDDAIARPPRPAPAANLEVHGSSSTGAPVPPVRSFGPPHAQPLRSAPSRNAGARLLFPNSIDQNVAARKATRGRAIVTLPHARAGPSLVRRRAQRGTGGSCSNRIGRRRRRYRPEASIALGRRAPDAPPMHIIGTQASTVILPDRDRTVGRRAVAARGATSPARRRYPRARTRSTAAKAATDGAGRARGRRGTAPSDRRRKCRMRE